jgi:hypothetical protein
MGPSRPPQWLGGLLEEPSPPATPPSSRQRLVPERARRSSDGAGVVERDKAGAVRRSIVYSSGSKRAVKWRKRVGSCAIRMPRKLAARAATASQTSIT